MLIRPERSLLVVSNMQELMMPICDTGPNFLWNVCWLLSLADKLKIPTLMVHTKGLGETAPEARAATNSATYIEINTFSFVENPATRAKIDAFGRDQLIFCGNETHISVLQSAMDAQKEGFHPYVVAEACAARDLDDHVAAVDRFKQNGVELVTREMVLFEWIRCSEDPVYRQTSIEFLKHPHPFPLPEHRV